MGKFDNTLAELKKIDLVDYLSQLGHQPQKRQGCDYWYLSPLRMERTASFKVNRKLNVWFDHGIGKGGNLIDFGIEYFNCSVRDLLHHGSFGFYSGLSCHSLRREVFYKVEKKEGKIKIMNVGIIQSAFLKKYLKARKIPYKIARQYCQEVDFKLYGQTKTALGFQNSSGGFELRSSTFKGSSSPKTYTFLEGNSPVLAVFEGFFNFLSYQVLLKNMAGVYQLCPPKAEPCYLILNSLSFFEKCRQRMDKYEKVHLFLDRDEAGRKFTQYALSWSSRYIDQSDFYKLFNDLNEYLVQSFSNVRQGCFYREKSQAFGRRGKE